MAAPGAIGGIASLTSLSVSFIVVTALCLAMALGAAALRPGTPSRTTTEPTEATAAASAEAAG
jgi:hypothetical protein